MKKLLNNIAGLAERFISPLAGKIAGNKHLQILAASFMSILPLIMIGSFGLIIAYPFLDYNTMETSNFFYGFFKAWADFSEGFGKHLGYLFNITLGSQGLWISIAIAFVTAKRRNLHYLNSLIVVFVSFLIVNGELIDWNWSTAYFGGTGLFSSIIVSFIAIDLFTYLTRKKIGLIKFPESVPQVLSDSIGTLVPMTLIFLLMTVFRAVFGDIIGTSFPALIMSLGSHLNMAIDSIWGISVASTLSQIGWWFGIHSSAILSVITPSLEANMLSNMNAFAEGIALVDLPTIVNSTFYYTYVAIGGGGATFGLVLLMLKSRSQQIRAIGKLSIIPAFFGINEPVLFGLPIVLNPIFLIPFLLSHVINIILVYFAMSMDLVNKIVMSLSAQTPIGISHVLGNLDFRSLILLVVCIVVNILVYYPFFKMFEKEKVEEETQLALEASKENEMIGENE
ncbi:MAG: PTS transporter subunit EIIC [Erysipelotrichaceae bacterium]